MRNLFVLTLLCLAAVFTATPIAAAQPYHLQLEVTPGSVFPWLGKFGDVDVHIYQGGVRGEALWLNAVSRTGSKHVTVANPLARMYFDVATSEIAPTLRKLAGNAAGAERGATPKLGPSMKGKVKGIAATRHRLVYGDNAWIDVWTTDVIPPNPQFRLLVRNAIAGVSPGTATVADRLPGTPVYVELNFRRFRKTPLVRLESLSHKADDEADALAPVRFSVRAGLLEKLLGVR
jgi:hypothetical protein